MLKAPSTKRLILKCDQLLSSFAFKLNLRRYTLELSMLAEALMEMDAGARPASYCPSRHRMPFDLISVSDLVLDLVSNTWYRIPFDQSALSISRVPPTDSLTIRPGRNP